MAEGIPKTNIKHDDLAIPYGEAEYKADLNLAKEKAAKGETKEAIEIYERILLFKNTPSVKGKLNKLKNESATN